MNNRIYVTIEAFQLPYEGKLDSLLHGRCQAFLPVSLIRKEEKLRLCAQTDGYRRLSSLNLLKAAELLEILSKVIRNMKSCRDFLYYPEDYVLSPDTIYQAKRGEQIRFLYVPSDRKISESKALKNLCHRLKSLTTENGVMYLETLEQLFSVEGLNEIRVQAFLNELLTEIYICGIE